VDARKAAVDEVERLLQHPEDLKRLPNMLEEYSGKHAANKAQLSATVGSQVDAARAGMELLEGAQKTLAKMQACYRVCAPRRHASRCSCVSASRAWVSSCWSTNMTVSTWGMHARHRVVR
jgi:hypothetical protein